MAGDVTMTTSALKKMPFSYVEKKATGIPNNVSLKQKIKKSIYRPGSGINVAMVTTCYV